MRRSLLLAVVPVLLLAACGSDATPAASGSKHEVVIDGFDFSPKELRLHVGDQLTVRNGDAATHTLTADDGSFDTGQLAKGKTKVLTLDEAGSFSYHCAIHTYMHGTVTVSK